jgi:hypothetical protein
MNMKAQINSMRDDAYDRMDAIKWEMEEAIEALRQTCPHTHTVSYPDPSGNNGGWRECIECGAEL